MVQDRFAQVQARTLGLGDMRDLLRQLRLTVCVNFDWVLVSLNFLHTYLLQEPKTLIHQWIHPLTSLDVPMEFVILLNRPELSPFARMVVMYIEKVPNRNSPPPFFDLILTEKEIKSKKEPWPTSQNYPMILSTIWNWLSKGRYNRDKKKGKTQIVFGLLC